MRRFTILAILTLVGCSHGSKGLFRFEIDFLEEDVVDLMRVVFQAGENAFVGDSVEPEDIVDPGGPGNAFTATYDLPDDARVGLGFGNGRVALQVLEDELLNADPLTFSIGTTGALEVEISYELRYDGETENDRFTEVDLLVSVLATRASALDPFEVEYFIDGEVFLGFTFCDVTVNFFSPGRPRDGIEAGFGDGEGVIDDPEVEAGVFDMDLDFDDDDTFRAEGEVGFCCRFRRRFDFVDVL